MIERDGGVEVTFVSKDKISLNIRMTFSMKDRPGPPSFDTWSQWLKQASFHNVEFDLKKVLAVLDELKSRGLPVN